MVSEALIMELTASTPSGGGFWLGGSFIVVRYGPDWWEWKACGKVFFDPHDLAETLTRRRVAHFRPRRHQAQAHHRHSFELRA